MIQIGFEGARMASREEVRWLTPAAAGGLVGILVLVLPWVRGLFISEGLRWLHILLFSFAGSITLTPVMVRVGHQLGLVDHPTERKIHRDPTPHIGGLAVYLGFVGSVLINSILADWMIAIL